MGEKIKVLHVLGSLNRGGTETWLMHVLRHIDRNKFQLDFMVATTQKCAYAREAQLLNARIIHNPYPRIPLLYAMNFIRNYRKYGPYDIVHCHLHYYSGLVLFLARMMGVPVRIVRSATDPRIAEASKGLLRRAYSSSMKKLIYKYATHGIAVSTAAAEDLFGAGWRNDKRWHILPSGIDLGEFRKKVDSKNLRKELGIPENAFVIGHVGRFVEAKNHAFLMEIAAEAIKRESNLYFLLVGDGPLRSFMEKKASELNIKDKIIFAGERPDIPKLMIGCMDLFLFPSIYEGLPVALIEAQAAGLICLISNNISTEVDICNDLIVRIDCFAHASLWAKEIIAIKKMKRKNINNEIYLETLEKSYFNIDNNIKELARIYDDALAQR